MTESNIQIQTDNNSDDILNFKRISTWLVFLFSIITFSVYYYVWLYTRTKKINEVKDDKPISMALPIAIIALTVL